MKKLLSFIVLISFITLCEISNAQTVIPPGDVSGTWTISGSPFEIQGDITIPDGLTLTIEPGVLVEFQGHYKFNVQGRLLAIGTETDTIVFTINDTTGFHDLTIPDGGWHGIRFIDTPSNNDSSKIVYCKLQYGKANTGAGYYDRLGGALCANINKLLVSHCMFRNNITYSTVINVDNGGAIAIINTVGNPIIEFCEFSENTSSYGGAIVIWGSYLSPLIRNNYFHHNRGHGIISVGSWGGSNTSPVLINNIVTNNYSFEDHTRPIGHGIIHFSNGGGVAVLINNTIINNSCDISGSALCTRIITATPLLINNIIYGNTPAQVWLGDVTSDLDFYNCLIEGGKEGFVGGALFTGTYENCIDVDPLFVSSNDFHLQNNSNCIGAAIDSVLINSNIYYCPPNDFDGNPRPNPSGSMPDIGAYENPLAIPAPTEIPAGDVSGTWTKANSPYNINGEITIPNDSTLTIEPGVEVVFTGHYKFNVQGRLLAIGTETDTIVFTINDKTGFHDLTIPDGGWHGIRFIDTPSNNDSSKIVYCKLQYGKANTGAGYYDRFGGALCANINKLLVSHCMFRNNTTYSTDIMLTGGGAISISGDPIIEFCEFTENTSSFGAAVIIWGYNISPLIHNNYFHHNLGHGTINIASSDINTSPVLINNIITNNISNECGTITSGHGIVHFSNGSGAAVLINNTIVNNSCTVSGGGIFVNIAPTPLLINNIIYGNTPSQVDLLTISSLSFYNCLVEGGKEGFTGRIFTGAYENCIDADPLFVSSNDYHLQNTSPCIGAAIDSILVGSTMHYCPPTDFEGNIRPFPVDTSPDIGAYENPLGNPVGVEEDLSVYPTEYALSQNYPNPFNPSTKIKYSVPKLSFVTIKIYDVLGSEVATLVNEEKPVGTYELNWNAANLPSGVYFYQLKAGFFVETKKMILLK